MDKYIYRPSDVADMCMNISSTFRCLGWRCRPWSPSLIQRRTSSTTSMTKSIFFMKQFNYNSYQRRNLKAYCMEMSILKTCRNPSRSTTITTYTSAYCAIAHQFPNQPRAPNIVLCSNKLPRLARALKVFGTLVPLPIRNPMGGSQASHAILPTRFISTRQGWKA